MWLGLKNPVTRLITLKRKILLWMSCVSQEFQPSLWGAVRGNQGRCCTCIPCHTATGPAPTLLSSFFTVPSDVLIGGSSGPPYISTHQHKDIFSWILSQYAQLWVWHVVYFISLTVTGERYGFWSLATVKVFEINSVRRRGSWMIDSLFWW